MIKCITIHIPFSVWTSGRQQHFTAFITHYYKTIYAKNSLWNISRLENMVLSYSLNQCCYLQCKCYPSFPFYSAVYFTWKTCCKTVFTTALKLSQSCTELKTMIVSSCSTLRKSWNKQQADSIFTSGVTNTELYEINLVTREHTKK